MSQPTSMPDPTPTPSPVTEKTRQVRDSILYVLPLFVGNLLPFVTLPILTRYLGTGDYGVLALAQAYAALVSSFANFGMVISYDRNYFQYQEDPRSSAALLFSSMAFVAALSLAGLCLTSLFRDQISALVIGDAVHGGILVAALASGCMLLVNQFFFIHLRNSSNARAYIGYTLAGNVITVALSLYFVVVVKSGVIGLVWAPLIVQGLLFAALLWRFLSSLDLLFNGALLMESVKMSYPLIPRMFMGTIDNQFDKYMIGLLNSLGGVGVYRIGQQIAMLGFSYMTQLENVFLPNVYRCMFNDPERGGEAAGKLLTPFAYVSVVVVMGIALFSEEVIILLTPPSFHGAADIVAVLSLFCGVLFFGKIIGTQILFRKKSFLSSLMGIGGLCINIALCIPFIRLWGAIGAAWAVLCANVLCRGIFFFIAQRLYRVHWEYGKIGAIYGLFFLSVLVMMLMRQADIPYALRLAFKLAALAGYAVLGVRIGILTAESWRILKNLATSGSAWTKGTAEG